jgi:TonB-dependent starch-binding outer membrane protein SusC
MRNSMKKTLKLQWKRYIHYAVILVSVQLICSALAFAQPQTVKGKITDSQTGEALPGVNIVEKGTTNGSVSSIDGIYSINVASNAVLSVSFIGYQALEIPVDGKSTIDVSMIPETTELDEIVAIGYGVVKKRDLTGSVSTVKAEDIQKTTTSNALQSMQARVPGLDVQQSSGQAGASVNINLRGNRSINASNSPLILVDGIVYGSTLDINPSDIESMEILKDASSTAIYGTRGANGVILITTKRGKAGKTQVNFNTFLSSNTPTNVPQVMYGDREVQRLIDKSNYQADVASGNWGASNLTPEQVLTESLADFTEIGIYNDKSYTDWADIILQNGLTQNYELSVSGGNEKTLFSISLGTMLEKGLMKNDQLDRYNGKMSVDHKINNVFKIGSSMLFTYKSQDARDGGVFNRSLNMTTLTHPYTAEGEIIKTPNPRYAAHSNPLLDEVDGALHNNNETTRFFGNTYLEVEPMKNLLFKSIFAVDRRNSRIGRYEDYESVGNLQAPATSEISLEYQTNTGITWDNTLNYITDFGGSNHNLTGLLGHSMTQSVYEQMLTTGNAGQEHYYSSSFYDVSKIIAETTTSNYIKSSLLSFFGRVNYKFNEKYLLTASVRADGSSRLAEGYKWGYFPSVAAGWRINEESFMENTSDWLTNLKLRASWGISGNSAIDPYQTLATLSGTQVFYYLEGKDFAGNIPSSLGNTSLSWEKTASLNFGFDFGIIDNRISGSIDYFINNTTDLLYQRSVPPSSVFPSVWGNIGDTEGSGIEIALNTVIAQTRDFNYNINWSFTSFSDKIVALADGVDKNINGRTGQIVGESISIFYDFEDAGMWDVGEFDAYKADWLARHPGESLGYISSYGTPGSIKIVDRDDNGKLDDDDKIVYNRSPKFILGMSNTFTYKNFDLDIMVYARLGGIMSYDMNGALNYESANWANLDYWTPANTGAKFPSPGLTSAAASTHSNYGSALLYEKADYLKIRDITLSYNLPKTAIETVGIDNVKVYGSLKNFFTFSNVNNYDPERGGAFTFPMAKQVVFGVNIQF